MAIFSNSFTGSVAIPDENPTGITNILAISGVPTGAFLSQIKVTLNIAHTWDEDLDIYLIDPDGNQIELSTDNGGLGDNYTNTVFVDSAAIAIAGLGTSAAPFTGEFRPEQALSTLYPGMVNGNWTLKIIDDFGDDVGTLTNWSIDLTFGEASSSIFPVAANESRSTVSASRTGHYSVSWNDNTADNGNVSNLVFAANSSTSIAGLGVGFFTREEMPADIFLRDGRHVIAYVETGNSDRDIVLKINSGPTFTGPTFFTSLSDIGDQVSPMVAELSNGNLIVAYVDLSTNTLQGRIFNTTTNSFGPAVTLMSPGATLAASPNPSLQPSNLIALSGGGFAVSYVGGPGGAANFQMNIFDNTISNGVFADNLVINNPTSSAALVQLADGNILRLVAGANLSGQAGVIMGIYNTSGVPLFPGSDLTTVPGVPSAEFHNLRATLLLDGRVMIVGSSLVEGAVAGSDIWGLVLNANRTLDGTAFRINGDNLAGTQSAPDIATLADGRVIVTWTDHSTNSGDITRQIIDIRTTGVNLTGYQNLNETWVGTRFDDFFNGGAGADNMNGGAGNDTAYYYSSAAGVTVNLTTGVGSGGEAAGDTLTSIEYVVGSNTGRDILTGNNVINYLAGFGADDTIDGGGVSVPNVPASYQGDNLDGGDGIDTLSYASSTQGVTVLMDWTSPTAGIAWNGTSGDVMINFENLTGSSYNDILLGNDGVNIIDGGLGTDSIYGKGGADIFHFGVLNTDVVADYQSGSDRLRFALSVADEFNDFTIYGNGTNLMSVVLNSNGSQIIVQGFGGGSITLTASDFQFI